MAWLMVSYRLSMISAQTLRVVARKTGTHFSGSCSPQPKKLCVARLHIGRPGQTRGQVGRRKALQILGRRSLTQRLERLVDGLRGRGEGRVALQRDLDP